MINIRGWIFHYLICAIIRHIKFVYVPTYELAFMNVILLHSIMTPQFSVEWFRHITIVFMFLFSSPWWWPHECSKHVDGYYVIKLHSYNQVNLLVPLKSLYTFLDSLLRETTDSSTHVRENLGDCYTLCSGLLLSSQYPEAPAIGRFATSFSFLFFFFYCFRCPSKRWDPFQVPDWYCVRHMRVCQINSSELDLLLGRPPNCSSPLASK
jgi:hypothetical protein